MNIRLSSTAPEFPRRTIKTTNSVMMKLTWASHLNFHDARSKPQTRLWRTSRETQKPQSIKTIHSQYHFADFPIIASTISNCSTTSHGIFASQIPNLHFANIWTLVQIWTLSKYSGEYFDSFLKSKHFDSFLFYSFFQIKTVTLFQKSNVLRILLGPVEA